MGDVNLGFLGSSKAWAVLPVLLAIFLLALAFGIFGAPMNMQPILGYLLKAFIGLVFGGIAALCLLYAVRMVRGGSRLPSDLLQHCLTCGERTPQDLVCPVCAEPPQNRSVSFQASNEEWLGEVFVALILTGVGCLGVFIMIGPFLDGERRFWALIAFLALGLLMFSVGAAGVIGFAISLWNRARGAKEISFLCRGPDRFTQGAGKIAWGKLVSLHGTGQISSPLAARGRSEGGYRASPGDMHLAEAVATFDAAGFIEMIDLTIHTWHVGDSSGKRRVSPLEFQRKTECRIIVKATDRAFAYNDEDEEEKEEDNVERNRLHEISEGRDEAIRRYLARYLTPNVALHEFKKRIDADPLHRTQLETHARVLRDCGVVVSHDLVEAVVEGLLRDNAHRA